MDFKSGDEALGWFRDRYREGTLQLKPPYQRKPVWTARQKCYLVESILHGLPIPEIYMQVSSSGEDDSMIYGIVDGQQRIRTVLQFVGAEEEPGEEEYNKFSLDKLPPNSPWFGKTFADLEAPLKKKFNLYSFAVRQLDTDDEEDVRDMFRRLNKFLTPLKPQELRNATYTGPFMKLANRLADDEFWAENRIVTPAAIRRMADIEYVSELIIGVLHGPQGGSPRIIDDYYAQFEDYEDEFPGQRKAERIFRQTLAFISSLFDDLREMRWSNKSDFYSLFVAVATLEKEGRPKRVGLNKLAEALVNFGELVDKAVESDRARVPTSVRKYAEAVKRGANDKARRADRHEVLIELIEPSFMV